MRNKITPVQAVEIRIKRANGYSLSRLASEYGITPAEVSSICCGRFWRTAGGPIVRKYRS